MEKIKKKLTVSIGTSAYNESQCIEQMLGSVSSQEEKNIVIKEIIVISDGSTDTTVAKVKKIQDKRIKIVNDNKRLGQPERIRQLLNIFKGEVLVILDSDMIMENKQTLEKIVSGFLNDKKIGLIGVNTTPLPPITFIESAINNYIYARASLYNEYDTKKSAYSVHGCMAFSRKFGKSLRIPAEILSTDSFSYFSCISQGYKFSFTKEAIIYYRSPQHIKDHINQSTRHLAGGIQLYDYFEKELIDSGFSFPTRIMIKIMLYQLRKNPLGYILLKTFNCYCKLKSKRDYKRLNTKWNEIKSSKTIRL